jgi:hypothetical protein
MTMSHEGRSAQIYQFPARGRFAASSPGASLAAPRLVTAALGGNWYHEEAIRDAERARQS